MGRLSTVSARAWKEALEEVRLNSMVRIVTGIISPIASGLIVWWITGNPAWGGVVSVSILLLIGVAVFATKMFTVPLAMASEAEAKFAELEAKQASAPPRHPDGIYQWGHRVGTVVAPFERLAAGEIEFHTITINQDFNASASFEYREFVLKIRRYGTFTRVSMPGHEGGSYNTAGCEIISRA